MNATTRKAIFKGIIVFAALAAVIAIVRISGLADILDKSWMDEHIRGKGLWGCLLFVILTAGFTGIGFPRQLLSFFGGYAFGAIFGTFWALMGTTLGCTCSFFYSRLAGKTALEKRYGKRIAKLNSFLQQEPFQMTIVIRLLPVGSNILTNLIAGVSAIPAVKFISGSCIGFIPQTLIFALLGSGMNVDPMLRTTLSAGLFIVSSVLGYRLYRKYRMENTMSD